MATLFPIVHEDEELLVINKPAGLVCHPTKGDAFSSLISRVRIYLRQNAAHLVNRLDRETSGIVLVAKNSSVAGMLGKLLEQGAVFKEYLAIVHGHVGQEHAMLEGPLGKDENSQVAIKSCVRSDGVAARTEVWVEQPFTRAGDAYTLLRVAPLTGRKHQIRIHLAQIGHPIVGDKLYGGDEDLYLDFVRGRLTEAQRRKLLLPYQALHAAKVQFVWSGRKRTFGAIAESWFVHFVVGNEDADEGRRINSEALRYRIPAAFEISAK